MVTLSDLSSCAKNDGKYCKLIATISNGFPSTRQQLDPELREYWEVRSRLSVNKGIVFLDDHTVIPNTLRNQILDNLHSGVEVVKVSLDLTGKILILIKED